MSAVTLAQASTIVDAALNKARELKQMPQTVVVLDPGGHVVCAKREDGSGIIRYEIAVGKAYGALGMGWGSRTMMERAAQNPNFLTAIVAASGGRMVPNPGGVLIRDAAVRSSARSAFPAIPATTTRSSPLPASRRRGSRPIRAARRNSGRQGARGRKGRTR